MCLIESVAIRTEDGKVYHLPKPNRHHHLIRHMVEVYNVPKPVNGEQGFMTSAGKFLNRTEARNHVIEFGQCRTTSHSLELFSEDLW